MDLWRWGVTVCAEAAGTQTQTQVGCFLSATKATVERERVVCLYCVSVIATNCAFVQPKTFEFSSDRAHFALPYSLC